ncbi:glycosyltransferase [Acidipila sp. EB88]|uniref:glycosyltransferase n=1 Tax=Acidipila sp. EB88 TaxID=2305226 RepID=UPI000F5F4B5B|nr:glycosyltransferase [Acidipila sp. EB88]RRA47319.1 glycosyltransferase [Acidipila sp. EB88]
MMRRVLVYRSDLLPPSETFIAAQAHALRRYAPVFAGLRRSVPTLALPSAASPSLARSAGERLLFQYFGRSRGLIAQVRAHAPALIHAHFALDGAEAVPLAQALGIPLVVTLHGYDVMCSDKTHRETRRGRRYLARRENLWRMAECFVCVSHAVRARALQQGFPADKLQVLPIGVRPEPCLRTLAPGDTVLFVGRLVHKKGCAILLDAMLQVQRQLPHAKLRVAGDGPERRSLESKASALGLCAEFLGMRSAAEVRLEMQQARCLAAPSITAASGDAEGLPIVLCEALGMGLPVASTWHSGIPELIEHRVHGLLAREGDAATLAQHLVELCSNDSLVQSLREAGYARIQQHFHLDRQTALLESLYDEAVAGQRRGPAASDARALTPLPPPFAPLEWDEEATLSVRSRMPSRRSLDAELPSMKMHREEPAHSTRKLPANAAEAAGKYPTPREHPQAACVRKDR